MPEIIPVGGPSAWTVNHAPAADTKATISRAAAGAGHCNVATGLTVMYVAGAAAPTAKTLSVAIIDGDTGGTTYLWGPVALSIPAVAGAVNGIALSSLWIKGTPNTKMTIEFSAAGGPNTVESVSLSGTVDVG